jgi:hypothetical protein
MQKSSMGVGVLNMGVGVLNSIHIYGMYVCMYVGRTPLHYAAWKACLNTVTQAEASGAGDR